MKRLREWRKAQGMTQEELAKQLGTSKSRVSNWENEKHQPSGIVQESLRRLGFKE